MSEKKKRKQDIRGIRSKEIMQDAMLALMEEKELKSITVTDIISVAGVNRSTFYAHYENKVNMIESMIDDIVKNFSTIFQSLIMGLNIEKNPDINNMLTNMFPSALNLLDQYIYNNRRFFTNLINNGYQGELYERINDIISVVWDKFHIMNKLSVPMNYAKAAVIGINLNLVMEWTKGGFAETPEEFNKIHYAIVKNLSRGIFNDLMKS